MFWFALTVRPQHERAVETRLIAKSLDGYAPLYTARRRWSDRTKTSELPLFPKYVFCRFSFDDRLRVLSTPGVTSIVGFGGVPAPVRDEEIEAVKSMTQSGLPLIPWPYLHIGQRVRIDSGPLDGLEGILAREKSAFRVVVNVELLNRAVAVEVERELIREAPVGRRSLFETTLAS